MSFPALGTILCARACNSLAIATLAQVSALSPQRGLPGSRWLESCSSRTSLASCSEAAWCVYRLSSRLHHSSHEDPSLSHALRLALSRHSRVVEWLCWLVCLPPQEA